MKVNLETFLSPPHPMAPVYLYGGVAFLQLVGLLVLNPQAWLSYFLWGLVGLLAWTLTEYVFHRFLFHPKPQDRLAVFARYMHWGHHERPHDTGEVAVSLWVSIPTYALILVGLQALTGSWFLAVAYGTGYAIGYVAYEGVHYGVHFFNQKNAVFQYLRRYHYLHHFKDDSKKFGVTSPLWDFVFKSHS